MVFKKLSKQEIKMQGSFDTLDRINEAMHLCNEGKRMKNPELWESGTTQLYMEIYQSLASNPNDLKVVDGLRNKSYDSLNRAQNPNPTRTNTIDVFNIIYTDFIELEKKLRHLAFVYGYTMTVKEDVDDSLSS